MNSDLNNYLRRDTTVLCYDGTIKKVQDLQIGDILMGDDSNPRKIMKILNGNKELYKIHPTDTTEPYYITGDQIICLRYNTRPVLSKENGKFPRYRIKYPIMEIKTSNGHQLSKIKLTCLSFSCTMSSDKCALEKAKTKQNLLLKDYESEWPLHEVQLLEYITQKSTLNHRLVAYRTGVEFSEYNDQEIDPYLLGIWLGDGTSSSTQITNIEPELIDYIYHIANKMDLLVTHNGDITYDIVSKFHRIRDNFFRNFLKDNNLINNKHIPHNYKVNSRANRLNLLAGLIDTDGHYNGSMYEIYQKNVTLARDIVFVARNLGFWCHIKPVTKGCLYKGEMRMGIYQKITFGGDNLNDIPVLVPRKKAMIRTERRQRDSLHYKFSVTQDEEDYCYGFELSGTNNRFLLGDFTVIHNSYIDNII